MEDFKNLKAIWKGDLPLNRIKWRNLISNEYQLSDKYKSKIKKTWDNHIKDYPNDYDGKLLFLDSFQLIDNFMYLDVSFIKFSTITFMVKNLIPVNKGLGMFGTQCLIFSPDKKYILVGVRSHSQDYFPGVIVNVGGMLEFKDLEKSPEEALMREIYEEIHMPLESDTSLKAILAGWNQISITFLISSTIPNTYDFNPNEEVIPVEKNEFEGNLYWLSIQELKNLHSNQLFEGLFYYRSEILKL